MRNMKVCLVTLVILVCNQVTAENERTTNGRQAKQLSLSDPEQKYDLDISLPVRILDSDEATNDDGRRERIDQLIQEILSNEGLVSRNDDILFSLNFIPRVVGGAGEGWGGGLPAFILGWCWRYCLSQTHN